MREFVNRWWVFGFVALMATVSLALAGHRDQSTEVAPIISLSNSAKTASTNNGTGVDLVNYESATVVVDFGTWTDGTHKVQIEESANNSTWTTVSAAEIAGSTVSVATSVNDDNTVYWFGYLGDERYIRVSGYVSGSTSSGAIYSGIVLRGRPRSKPTQ